MTIKNIRLAFRNLLQNRGINSINIIGLAIGIMAVLLIYQYIGFERSYDRYFDNADRIQRLVFYRYYQTGLDKSVGNNYIVGQTAYERIPAIENFCRCKRETQFIQAGDEIFKEERTLFADSSLFDIFSYKVVSGNKSEFLRSPDVAIITESLAKIYFGNENPVGKIIYGVNPGKKPLLVQGVIKDAKPNSHLKFDLVISLSTITNKSYCYTCNNTNTYFLLRKDADPIAIADQITSLAKEYFVSIKSELTYPIEYHLQPISDIHLHSNYRFEHEANGNNKYLSILLAIALLILISAGLNYFNLYSSIISRRINGIGIRIINGASGRDTISEFITEALLTGLISLLLAFILLDLLFPFFGNYLNLDFGMESLFQFKTWLLPISILIILSVLSGIVLGIRTYGIAPVSFIRKELFHNNKKFTTRLYIVIQFIIAIILIAGTIGALKQINYMQKDAFTMNIDQTLVVKRPVARDFNLAQISFQESLLKLPEITDITYSTITPGEKNTWVKGGISLKGKEKMDYQFFQADVAPGFFSFFSVKLLAGRYFYPDETNWEGGPRHLILNKEAAIALGEENLENIIGKNLLDFDYDSDKQQELGEIVGVIDGYFQNSLDQEIKPTIYNCDQYGYSIFMKTHNANIQNVVGNVKNEFQKYFKDQYFEYFFLDEYFNAQYKSHVQLFRCFVLFSMMAAIITSLSLLGLVIMVSSSRTKEIGIRKLNGAKTGEVLYMLNREFIMLVTISYLVAAPIAWYSIHKWLQSFAYRTELSWWIFALAGLIALGVAVVTVSWQSWRAATRNPVEALRYE
ncbi:MAG TPA: ABC transporter permease [Bacteroidales bacterium]|nr:ABC transporter permease [Bacteroidales bacterium]